MATITIPNVATQQEIRCDGLICRNNLDVSEDNPLQKYSIILDRMAEPQDATGKRIGDRVRLPSLSVPMTDLFTHDITINGVTMTGAQIMGFVNALIDDYKADGLS